MMKAREWTKEELAYLRANYPTESAVDIADHIGVSATTVKNKAVQLGIKKSPDFDKKKFRNRYVHDYKNGWYKNCKTACAIMLLLFLCGCSPKVITVEKTHTEYVHNTDTITIKDTVRSNTNTIIREARPEDSLLLAQYGIRLKENERMLLFLQKQLEQEKSESKEVVHDTTIVRDTIPQIVPVEKELTWWQRQKIAFGELAMIIMAGLLCFVVIRFKK